MCERNHVATITLTRTVASFSQLPHILATRIRVASFPRKMLVKLLLASVALSSSTW